jgi:hypothetical protein
MMLSLAAIQLGPWRSSGSHPRRKTMDRDQIEAFLQVSRMGGHSQNWNAEKALRNDFRDFQAVEPLALQFPEDLPHCPAFRFISLTAKDNRADLTGYIKEVPFRLREFAAEFVPIEISDSSPTGQERFTLYRQACRQKRLFSDENGSRIVVG